MWYNNIGKENIFRNFEFLGEKAEDSRYNYIEHKAFKLNALKERKKKKMKFITKYGDSPFGKRRVYLTSHPDDFEKCFEKITGDIFKTHDCVIYYTEDMTEPLDEENLETDLGSNNLFVVPVTYKLLSQPSRAMEVDIPYAKEHNIPILPILAEDNLEDMAALPKNFGIRPLLTMFTGRPTVFSFEARLKEYLDAVLLDDATVKEIDASDYVAPSAYYNDGVPADPEHNYLIGLEKIAGVWERIDRSTGSNLIFSAAEADCPEAMKKMRDMYTVGDSVEPNHEKALYYAKKLSEYYKENCGPFSRGTLYTLFPLAFLLHKMGNVAEAYDVIENIYFAAEECLEEDNDDNINLLKELIAVCGSTWNKSNLSEYAEILYDKTLEMYGEDDPRTTEALAELANASSLVWEDEDATSYGEKVRSLLSRKYGKNSPAELKYCNFLAEYYEGYGDCQKAEELYESVYTAYLQRYGEKHIDTVDALIRIATVYARQGKYKEAAYLNKESYRVLCSTLGRTHPLTALVIGKLSMNYEKLGNASAAAKTFEKKYRITCSLYGSDHIVSLLDADQLLELYKSAGFYEKAVALGEELLDLQCAKYGPKNTVTVSTMQRLAYGYSKTGMHENAVNMMNRAYSSNAVEKGPNHRDTVESLILLAGVYDNANRYDEAIETLENIVSIARGKPNKHRRFILKCEMLIDSINAKRNS